jgi:two-component system chemotaxis sensor kinase CheA
MLDLGVDAIGVSLRAADVLADLVREARDGQPVRDDVIAAVGASLLTLSPDPGASNEEELFADFVPQPAAFTLLASQAPPIVQSWIVRMRPYADLYAKANDSLLILRDLAQLGALEVSLDDSALPTLDALDPEEGYLSWSVALRDACEEEAIRKVFEFVEGDCDLEIGPVPSSDADTAQAQNETPRAAEKIVASRQPQQIPSGDSGARAPSAHTIRVDLDRLDGLANLVGELVINHALLTQRISGQGSVNSGVAIALEELGHLTHDLQDCVMAVRAQPLKYVFQRMARVVRDVEAATGKQARLVIEGEDTEIDRTLIEGLSDPLTHILRNAVDHGLETPADRCALGKAPQGIVRISARHRAGRVVVEVADDGAGINRTRVRQIAIERGLIAREAQLSDDEVDQLIFLPGFSTASAVSAVSGRGVGMDVVKCAIQSLGGRVLLHSVSGVGTTVTISLPLTLAVLDGMVVTACSQTFVAPLTSVLEAIPLKPGDLQRVGADLEVLALRGLRVPAIDLASALGLRATPTNGLVRFALVVEDDTGRRAALLVDEIQDQRQIVIKSLETNYRNVDGVAAATILGEGKVALILDVDTILASARRSEFAPPRLAASR